MLIRICLIIALVAGLAAGVIGYLKVGERLTTTLNERDEERTIKEKTQADLAATNRFLNTTLADLSTTKGELATTASALQNMTAQATEHERRATDLASRLTQITAQRDSAQQELSAWSQTGLSPDQVKGMITDYKRTQEARDTYIAENRILNNNIIRLENELARYRDPDTLPTMPVGLKGSVVAVDPKFDFVVLDIGENQGVKERGELLVNRRGKLVGRVKVSSVEPNRSVANIMPGWKQDEILEGDQVIY